VSRREEILDAAGELLEERGPEALTMREVAARLGIRAPSLYKHVRDKEDIEAGLQERALLDMGTRLAAAGRTLPELAGAYRTWARANPRLYRLVAGAPLHRDRLTPGVEAAAAEPLVRAVGGDEHRARAAWALVHGLVDLELADRFPPGADLDATWRTAVAAFAGADDGVGRPER
jgi:AcrR family transcriptional regulator